MVQTRRQYQHWVEHRGDNYQSSQSTCSECSQASSQQSNAYSFQHEAGDSHMPSYGTNDHCKRHRHPDSDPYSEVVTSYHRRKPRS